MAKITYEDKLTIILDKNDIVQSIECNLPVLGEGMDRIVYERSNDKVLKVAKTIRASCINWDEIMIYENIKGKECIVHFPDIYIYMSMKKVMGSGMYAKELLCHLML